MRYIIKLKSLILVFIICILFSSCEEPESPTFYTINFISYLGEPHFSSQQVLEGECATKPAPPVMEDYVFIEWYYTDESGNSYRFDFSVPITRDYQLYARWRQENSFYFGFETGEGTYIPSVTLIEDEVTKRPEDPVREGYEFEGWFVDSECTVEFEFGKPLTENTLVYAKWEPKIFTMTFEISYPEGASGKPEQYVTTVTYEGFIKMPDIEIPVGYELYGWKTESDAWGNLVQYDFADRKYKHDMVFYPIWKFILPDMNNSDGILNYDVMNYEEDNFDPYFVVSGIADTTVTKITVPAEFKGYPGECNSFCGHSLLASRKKGNNL